MKASTQAIIEHAFFADFDFGKLVRGELDSPFGATHVAPPERSDFAADAAWPLGKAPTDTSDWEPNF